MRTHCLQTYFPPEPQQPDAGRAANDGRYASGPVAVAATENETETARCERVRDDHYELGGYAGI